MKRACRIALFVLLLTFPALTQCQKSDVIGQEKCANTPQDREIIADLIDYLETSAKADKFSGVVFLARDEDVLLYRAYGPANRSDGIPNTVNTRFNMASASKMFTAVAIAQLAEQGKLSFDDPIGLYLDADWVSQEVSEKVLIRHLLSHTSGFGLYWDEWDHYSNTIRKLDDYKPIISDRLAFEPGSKWEYSNTGFLLLGVIIEKVAGQSYYDYVQEEILDPCGMEDSGFLELDFPHPDLATGYYMDAGRIKNNLFRHGIKGSSAGGAWATAADLHRFFLALKSDKLISSDMRELLWTPNPMSSDYGYGFQIQSNWIGHNGGFPGINAAAIYYPQSGHTLVILSNYSAPDFSVTRLSEIMSRLRQNGNEK